MLSHWIYWIILKGSRPKSFSNKILKSNQDAPLHYRTEIYSETKNSKYNFITNNFKKYIEISLQDAQFLIETILISKLIKRINKYSVKRKTFEVMLFKMFKTLQFFQSKKIVYIIWSTCVCVYIHIKKKVKKNF